jgi:hypothetical protein
VAAGGNQVCRSATKRAAILSTSARIAENAERERGLRDQYLEPLLRFGDAEHAAGYPA